MNNLPDTPSSSIPAFLSTVERVLFSRTLEHPDLGQYVQWAPIDWVLSLSNPHFSETTDNGQWGTAQRLTLNDLFMDILEKGMRDPLLLGVGLMDGRIRLETGNQRIRVFAYKGIRWVPVVAYVGDRCVTHLANGCHIGEEAVLKVPKRNGILGPYPMKYYAKVTDVVEAPDLR